MADLSPLPPPLPVQEIASALLSKLLGEEAGGGSLQKRIPHAISTTGLSRRIQEMCQSKNDKVRCDNTDKQERGSSSGSEYSSEDDSSSDANGDAKVPLTYPYDQHSEEEESDEDLEDVTRQWLLSINSNPSPIEVITLDDRDEGDIQGEMRCLRCPPGQAIYKNKNMFLLHRERHKGVNHFVCPTCLKPFIKISFCFAHEIRVHGTTFAYQHPLLDAAVAYRAAKEEEKAAEALLQQEQSAPSSQQSSAGAIAVPDFPDLDLSEFLLDVPVTGDVIKSPYCHNFAGLVLFPEDGEYETDEDAPKFYPDHAVPSTSLYPYRGIEPLSVYDCYEIHLKFGRMKKTAANTISRCVLAHRRKLIEEGRIAENDIGRFWKPPPPPLQRAGGKRKKEDRGEDRKRNKRSPKKKPIPKEVDVKNRDFVNGVISRVCLACTFMWRTQEELKQHRDAKHPGKTILELMTVPVKKRKHKRILYLSSDDEEIQPKKKKAKVKNNDNNFLLPPPPKPFYPPPTPQQVFLSALGLIHVDVLAAIPRPRKSIRPCYVKLVRLGKQAGQATRGRFYVCQEEGCGYYAATRNRLSVHRFSNHCQP